MYPAEQSNSSQSAAEVEQQPPTFQRDPRYQYLSASAENKQPPASSPHEHDHRYQATEGPPMTHGRPTWDSGPQYRHPGTVGVLSPQSWSRVEAQPQLYNPAMEVALAPQPSSVTNSYQYAYPDTELTHHHQEPPPPSGQSGPMYPDEEEILKRRLQEYKQYEISGAETVASGETTFTYERPPMPLPPTESQVREEQRDDYDDRSYRRHDTLEQSSVVQSYNNDYPQATSEFNRQYQAEISSRVEADQAPGDASQITDVISKFQDLTVDNSATPSDTMREGEI